MLVSPFPTALLVTLVSEPKFEADLKYLLSLELIKKKDGEAYLMQVKLKRWDIFNWIKCKITSLLDLRI